MFCSAQFGASWSRNSFSYHNNVTLSNSVKLSRGRWDAFWSLSALKLPVGTMKSFFSPTCSQCPPHDLLLLQRGVRAQRGRCDWDGSRIRELCGPAAVLWDWAREKRRLYGGGKVTERVGVPGLCSLPLNCILTRVSMCRLQNDLRASLNTNTTPPPCSCVGYRFCPQPFDLLHAHLITQKEVSTNPHRWTSRGWVGLWG